LPSDFPVVGPIQASPSPFLNCPLQSVFISKLNPAGSALVYSTLLGGVSCINAANGFFNGPRGIAVDSAGSAYVTGQTNAPDYPTTAGSLQPSAPGNFDGFLSKLDPTGQVLVYSTYLGGGGFDHTRGIAIDAEGAVYIVADTGGLNSAPDDPQLISTDFPVTAGAFQTAWQGGEDALVIKIAIPTVPLQFVTFPELFPALPDGSVGVQYFGNIGIGGGQPPYTVTLVNGALPAGLHFGSPVIGGTPLQTETALFTVQVTDQLGSLVQQTMQISIGTTADNPVPALTSLAPAVAAPGGNGFVMTVTGSNFLPGSIVRWNGSDRVTTFIGSSQLQATIAASDIAMAGVIAVTVFTPAPGGGTSNAVTFAVAQPFTLTIDRSGAGAVSSSPARITCGPTCAADFASGTTVTLTAAAMPGSVFRGWGGACSGTGACMVTLTASSTVTAAFVPVSTLTVSTSGSGTVTSTPPGIACGATCAADYAQGTTLTLTATAAAGSVFTGWSGACSGTGACMVTLAASTTVGATFATPLFGLTINLTGRGSGAVTISGPSVGITCGATCAPNVPSGTTAVLTAGASSGSVFGGWSGGGCAGTGACQVTVTAATTVTALFLPALITSFADHPLVARSSVIGAVHVIELRLAIDGRRAVRGLAPFAWTDATVTSALTVVRRIHVIELRQALNEVYAAASMLPPTYSDPALASGETAVKASHLAELRAAVLAGP
jgi:hypothetical protein